ncbi:MAG: hypothetical protein EOP84_16100, partial [Verrucomicrobiaceae bacterium]
GAREGEGGRSDGASDPVDHLVLLASQILATLRDIILARYRKGRSLQEIFQHFDRDRKRFFDREDFVQATRDLRIEVSDKVASLAIQQMGVDSLDCVCFGEFKTFVLDAEHRLLELQVTEQLAALFEQQGRAFLSFLAQALLCREPDRQQQEERDAVADEQPLLDKATFLAGLRKAGLVLSSADLSRLADRFDVHGNDFCSSRRFLKMLLRSAPWRHAEKVLRYQDRAMQEAARLRQELVSNPGRQTMPGAPPLTEELIAMCEYLGICVLSEQNMIWIAADALKAPLPVNWVALKDESGRTFFHNRLSGQSRWEHPLDPHFRKLRDKYRQSSEPDASASPPPFRRPPLESLLPSLSGWQSDSAGQPPLLERFAPRPFNELLTNHSEPVQANRPQSAAPRPAANSLDRLRPISAPFKTISFREAGLGVATDNPHPPPSAVLSATKALTEAIYSAGYYKANGAPNRASELPPAPFAPYQHSAAAVKPRAAASTAASNSRRRTAVERALSLGRVSQTFLKLDKESGLSAEQRGQKGVRLAEMLEGDILEKLDAVMGSNQR